jgi:hypothetical protein
MASTVEAPGTMSITGRRSSVEPPRCRPVGPETEGHGGEELHREDHLGGSYRAPWRVAIAKFASAPNGRTRPSRNATFVGFTPRGASSPTTHCVSEVAPPAVIIAATPRSSARLTLCVAISEITGPQTVPRLRAARPTRLRCHTPRTVTEAASPASTSGARALVAEPDEQRCPSSSLSASPSRGLHRSRRSLLLDLPRHGTKWLGRMQPALPQTWVSRG